MSAWRFFKDLFGKERNDIRSILGAARHTIIDLSGAEDQTMIDPSNDPETASEPKKGCRYFEVDVEGIIAFDYTDDTGNTTYHRVMTALAGINHYGNITKVYATYDGSNACTAQVYGDDGALVVGVALCY